MRKQPDKGNGAVKERVVVKCGGKIQPDGRNMRARHAAEGTADSKKSVSRANTSKQLRKNIK